MSRTEYVRPLSAPASQPGAWEAARLLLADRYVGLTLTALSALLALWSVYRMGVWALFHLRCLAEAWVGKKEDKAKEEVDDYYNDDDDDDAHTVRHPNARRRRQ